MNGRVPAARYAEEIAFDSPPCAACERGDVDRCDMLAAVCGGDGGARHDRQTVRARRERERARYLRFRARIDDGGDRNAGPLQRERGGVLAVIVGEYDGTRSAAHGVAVD